MYVDINQCQSVVANFPNDIESIFIKSDTSMYKAKASGGNEVYI